MKCVLFLYLCLLHLGVGPLPDLRLGPSVHVGPIGQESWWPYWKMAVNLWWPNIQFCSQHICQIWCLHHKMNICSMLSYVASLIGPLHSHRNTHTHTHMHRRQAAGSHTPIWIPAVITFLVSLSSFALAPLTLSLFVFFSYTPGIIPDICCVLSPRRQRGRIPYSFCVCIVCWHRQHPICVNVTPAQLHQQRRHSFNKWHMHTYIYTLLVLMTKHWNHFIWLLNLTLVQETVFSVGSSASFVNQEVLEYREGCDRSGKEKRSRNASKIHPSI